MSGCYSSCFFDVFRILFVGTFVVVSFKNSTSNSMKNIFLLLVFFILFSCSSNDETDQQKLLKSIVEILEDGSSATTLFTYDGNNIKSIDEVDKSTVFAYTDNLITEATIVDKTTQNQIKLQYLYDNDRLIKIESSENYIINYDHNSDGTVSYEKIQKDSGNNIVSHLHGVLYFENDNLKKDERSFYDPDSYVKITESENFEYDAKINPMRNVLGFDKLLDYSKHVSPNNSTSFWKSYTVDYLVEDQVTSSALGYQSDYKYDSDGYPTRADTEKPFLAKGNSKRVKIIFNYK